jgi:hypothetical protein
MGSDNNWNKPASPPPPLFFNDKERALVKQVNDELIERVLGQDILYFPISFEHTNFHSLYGEAIKKTYYPPIHIYALVDWEGDTTETKNGIINRTSSITVHFHKRRLTEDQDLFVQEGDYVQYNKDFYEIVEINEPKELFGQTEHKVEITAKCINVNKDIFDGT